MTLLGHPLLDTIVTIFVSVLASSGFWGWLQARQNRDSTVTKMLRGLAHDRIIHVGKGYIKRGYVTVAEYDDFVTYLYEPYVLLGGNGSAEKIAHDVKQLPVYPVSIEKETLDVQQVL